MGICRQHYMMSVLPVAQRKGFVIHCEANITIFDTQTQRAQSYLVFLVDRGNGKEEDVTLVEHGGREMLSRVLSVQ